MSQLFSESELETISSEIDRQLCELEMENIFSSPFVGASGAIPPFGSWGVILNLLKKIKLSGTSLPKKQKNVLQQVTGQDADSFLKDFFQIAKKDLCQKGGLLHDQWELVGNLDKESMLRQFGTILTSMGLVAEPLQTVLIAICVIIFHLGIKTICERYSKQM